MGMPLPGLVESVTVFRRGAAVRRAFELPSGVSRVALGPLPRALDDGTVRVQASVGASVRELRVELAVFAPDAALAPADSEALEAARLELARAEAKVATLQGSLQAIASLTMPPRSRAERGEPGPIPNDARLALATFRAERSQALRAALLDAEEALVRARDRVAVEEDRERRATSARRTRVDELRKQVELVLAEPTEAGARLVLEYAVPGAGWAPSYALRFDAAMTKATLERRAYVAQRSGEDWSGVRLSLSTAEPTRWTELPDLPSLRIGRRQSAPARRGWRAPPTGADALFADYDAAFAEPTPKGGASSRTGSVSKEAMEELRRVAASSAAIDDSDDDESFAIAAGPPPMLQSMPMPQAPPASFGAPPGGAPMPPPPRGAPAPMAPMAAAMPARAAMAPTAKKSRGMLGGFGGGGAELEEGFADLGLPAEAPVPSGIAIDVELLVYARLRLAAIDGPSRGKLMPTGRVGALAEALGDRVVGDLGASLIEAERAASRLAPVPPGATLASAVDGFDHAFEVASRVDVPSDGAWHGVRVGDESMPCDAKLVVVPRESDDVFRFVQLAVKGAPLLRGPVDVFVGDRYLLARELGPTSTGGSLRLGLGVEPGVRVARNVRFEERSAGLMGRALELVHDVEVELRSSLTSVATIEVRERVPTTREGDDEIEVREDEVSPTWERWEPDANDAPQGRFDGGRRWRVKLEPGATRRLRARWVIRIAAKNELVGGNRRES
jgi:hypothetical protein